MELLGLAYGIISFVAYVLLIMKADSYDSVWSVIFAPITIHRIVLGRGRYILVPIVLSILPIIMPPFALLFNIVLIIWYILFAIALGEAFGRSKLFKAFLVFLPGISTIVLAFSFVEYQGNVNLFYWLQR